ncbi:MAG: DUF3793 family protein [Treponema sp.]|jgi:hypothetical protein|nr:DUF3793 family protein [Treponema sp.]
MTRYSKPGRIPRPSGRIFEPAKNDGVETERRYPALQGGEGHYVEQALIKHLGPVLLGRKPAALFVMPSRQSFCRLKAIAEKLLLLDALREQGNGVLTLACDRDLTRSLLAGKMMSDALAPWEYPQYRTAGSAACLRRLKQRFKRGGEFPHEVGLFLGYPPEDVAGFIRNKGRNCKCCGVWKVYGDEERAQSLFREFGACGEYVRSFLADGGITDLAAVRRGSSHCNYAGPRGPCQGEAEL